MELDQEHPVDPILSNQTVIEEDDEEYCEIICETERTVEDIGDRFSGNEVLQSEESQVSSKTQKILKQNIFSKFKKGELVQKPHPNFDKIKTIWSKDDESGLHDTTYVVCVACKMLFCGPTSLAIVRHCMQFCHGNKSDQSKKKVSSTSSEKADDHSGLGTRTSEDCLTSEPLSFSKVIMTPASIHQNQTTSSSLAPSLTPRIQSINNKVTIRSKFERGELLEFDDPNYTSMKMLFTRNNTGSLEDTNHVVCRNCRKVISASNDVNVIRHIKFPCQAITPVQSFERANRYTRRSRGKVRREVEGLMTDYSREKASKTTCDTIHGVETNSTIGEESPALEILDLPESEKTQTTTEPLDFDCNSLSPVPPSISSMPSISESVKCESVDHFPVNNGIPAETEKTEAQEAGTSRKEEPRIDVKLEVTDDTTNFLIKNAENILKKHSQNISELQDFVAKNLSLFEESGPALEKSNPLFYEVFKKILFILPMHDEIGNGEHIERKKTMGTQTDGNKIDQETQTESAFRTKIKKEIVEEAGEPNSGSTQEERVETAEEQGPAKPRRKFLCRKCEAHDIHFKRHPRKKHHFCPFSDDCECQKPKCRALMILIRQERERIEERKRKKREQQEREEPVIKRKSRRTI